MNKGRPTITLTWVAAIVAALVVFAVYQGYVNNQFSHQNHVLSKQQRQLQSQNVRLGLQNKRLISQQRSACSYQHDATLALNKTNAAIAHIADVAIHNLSLRVKADANNPTTLKIDKEGISLYKNLKDSIQIVEVPTCK